ncbi:hypothetical protein PUN28_012699 [Cardiocondyla obscurior]|uniref:Uncharacterized protein n=1 Tax=Cardiocondyla obscurior TaxID=286306 RepID=A0AAW2FI61_9HYME
MNPFIKEAGKQYHPTRLLHSIYAYKSTARKSGASVTLSTYQPDNETAAASTKRVCTSASVCNELLIANAGRARDE